LCFIVGACIRCLRVQISFFLSIKWFKVVRIFQPKRVKKKAVGKDSFNYYSSDFFAAGFFGAATFFSVVSFLTVVFFSAVFGAAAFLAAGFFSAVVSAFTFALGVVGAVVFFGREFP
jgi:predicted permease